MAASLSAGANGFMITNSYLQKISKFDSTRSRAYEQAIKESVRSKTYAKSYVSESIVPKKSDEQSIMDAATGYEAAKKTYKQTKIDPSRSIKYAIQITKKYGVASPEAKVAWEAVEKIEYTYKTSSWKKNSDVDASWFDSKAQNDIRELEALSKPRVAVDASSTLQHNLRDLKKLIDDEMLKVMQIKEMTKELKVKRVTQSARSLKTLDAISSAQECIREYGNHAPQTKMAWDSFQHILYYGDLAP